MNRGAKVNTVNANEIYFFLYCSVDRLSILSVEARPKPTLFSNWIVIFSRNDSAVHGFPLNDTLNTCTHSTTITHMNSD